MRNPTVLAFAGLVLAACGEGAQREPEETTAPPVAEAPDPTSRESSAEREPMPDRDDLPAPGETPQRQWFAKTERGVPTALYGPPRTEADFLVRCEGSELVFVLSRPIGDEEPRMTVTAGGQTRSLDARERPGPLPQTAARLPASDSFAAVLEESTGPVSVRLGEGSPLRMPSHEHFREVVANCRD